MTDTEYELVKGVYLSNSKTDKPNCDGFYVDTVDSGDVCIYMSHTDEVDKYITVKEDDLRKAAQKLFPDKEIDPEELFDRIFYILGDRNRKLEGAKHEKKDGTFSYKLRNGYYGVCSIPFLHKQDLSFENPEDIETIKSYQHLEWPSFSADQTKLADLMQAKGYPVKHHGRSGFESRNIYRIEIPDTPEEDIIEVITKINQDIEAAKKELELENFAELDRQFNENAYDEDGIFSYVFVGGGIEDPQDYDAEKYGHMKTVRTSDTQDHRRNISHEYMVVLYNIEKLKQNTRKIIVLNGYAYCSAFESLSSQYNIMFKFNEKGRFKYIINGRTLSNVSHLDLDLAKPEDVEKALAQDKLEWPTINATSTILKEKLEKMGYVLEHQGRSGIARRNHYDIRTQDGIITPEAVAQISQDLKQAEDSVHEEKKQAFDRYFDEQSTDKAKVYAVVETGYDYDLTHIIDKDKYESVAQIRTACTSDRRYGYSHTYAELFINKERIKDDKRKFIVLEVPKDMIGLIIGKGGCHIKEIQQKFGKHFKVVQDPREIEAEKKRQEEEAARKRKYELQSLQSNIRNFMGENFIASDDESIAISMVEYITNYQDKLSVRPTQEELQQMKENLIIERDEKIKRENERKAEEIARQKRLEEERIAEQKRLEQEKIAEITQAVKKHIQAWADEHNGKVLPNEDLVKFLQETYQEDTLAQKFTGAVQKDFFLKMEEERAMQKRFAEAEKRFDKVVSEEFQKFFESDYETGGHGYGYFGAVGKARRASGYNIIAERVEHRLGIYEDLYKSLEERLLDPRPQEDRWLSYLYEETKFRDRIIEFNENVGDFEEYLKLQKETNEPKPTLEPTIENLAILWGAKQRKLK